MKPLLLLSILFTALSANAIPPDFEELVEKTYGVHLTRVYPKDGCLMIPGSLFSLRKTPIEKQESKEEQEISTSSQEVLTLDERLQLAKVTPKYRFTLHWALSDAPEDNDFQTEKGETLNVNRAQYPFAILEPFKHLLPESYGGHDQDWITVGPHKLSKESILLAANTHEKEVQHFPGKVILFDPSTERLGDILPKILQERKAFALKRDIPVSMYDTEEKALKTGYNEDNIPLTVDEKDHYKSPKEFYTSLREQGYFWGKHHGTFFAKFENFLKPFFERTITFQAKQLFPEKLEAAALKGFRASVDPIAYVTGSIKEFRPFIIQKTKLSERTQKTFNLWLKELQIWVEYVCKKDSMTDPEFLKGTSDPAKLLKQVVATVDKYSTQPMLKLFQEDNKSSND